MWQRHCDICNEEENTGTVLSFRWISGKLKLVCELCYMNYLNGNNVIHGPKVFYTDSAGG